MPYKFRDIEKRLNKLGFSAVRQKRSHVLFYDGKKSISCAKPWLKRYFSMSRKESARVFRAK